MVYEKPIRTKRGSSTIEYIVGVAAVISVLLVFFQPAGVFRGIYNNVLSSVSGGMTNMADRLVISRSSDQSSNKSLNKSSESTDGFVTIMSPPPISVPEPPQNQRTQDGFVTIMAPPPLPIPVSQPSWHRRIQLSY